MITLSKQFAVTIQSSKPLRSLKLSSSVEHVYLISSKQRVFEVSSSGKLRKILIPRKEAKILTSGISECLTLTAGLISTGQIVVSNKKKKIFQSLLLPPQIKIAIELLKPENCSLYVFDTGIVLVVPSDQVWLWKSEVNLKDPFNVSPYLKGNWLNLNSVSLLRGRSELSSLRSNMTESKPSSNSSRNAALKSRYKTHAFSVRYGSNYIMGSVLGVLRVWLRSINEDSCTLESRFLSVNLVENQKAFKQQSLISGAEEFIFKGVLDFWSKKGHKDSGLVARLDHSSSIAAIGVNSSHPFFCQIVFLNPRTGVCTARKLCNYVTVDDIPTTSSDGQTSFWIDDMVWAPDDNYLAVAFKSGFLSIFNRLGEPINFVLDMIKTGSESRIFSHAFFTTDPECIRTYGSFLSLDWAENEILLSDGFSICELAVRIPTIKEIIPIYIPQEPEAPDISINISHETSPIPSEFDSGPKRKNILLAFHLLRSCLSNNHAYPNKELIFAITSWIDSVLPPQLHEEINYTTVPNSRFETEARLSNNLILKKKMHAIDVYQQFCHVINMEEWSMVHHSETKEWVMSISYQVFKYMIADHQALYAWDVLKLFERWTGLKLQRIRNMLVIYSLIQYRNHQANHINVSYFLIAYAAVRGNYQNVLPVLTKAEEDFLRCFIKQGLDISQQTDAKVPFSLSSFYYLNPRIKEKVDGPLNYLMGYSNSFSDSYSEICCQLLKGNVKYIDSYLNTESFLLFAYFFDPTELRFVSPIEACSLFSVADVSIQEMLQRVRRLSQVPVNKDKKYLKDAAFLYYILRVYSKIEELLQPDTAFYVINKLIPVLESDEAQDAMNVLKRLFLKDSYLKLLELCHPSLKSLFQIYTLDLIEKRLKDFILKRAWTNKNCGKYQLSDVFYETLRNDEIEEILVIFTSLIGEVEIINDKTDNWLNLEKSNFSDIEATAGKRIHDMLRYLWYLRINEKVEGCNDIEWRIRLLAVQDLLDKNKILEMILSDRLQFSVESKDIIALYLRASVFPVSSQDNYKKWVERVQQSQESAHIIHSLSQPAYMNPWIFDSDFLDFAGQVVRVKVSLQLNHESICKSWNSTVKSLSKQYKTTGFIKYTKGIYSEVREKEDLDFSAFASIFTDPVSLSVDEEQRDESEHISPIIQLKKRLNAEFAERLTVLSLEFSISHQIACKKMGYIFKAPLRRILSALKPAKKLSLSPALKLKKTGQEFLHFFTLSKSKKLEENTIKLIPLKIFNILQKQQKSSKHRRIQSVLLPSVTIQRPFQLFRVKKSYV